MTPIQILHGPVKDALAVFPPHMTSNEAHVLLLAIGLQESRFTTRRQIKGPARGFWQFEKNGGVKGVLTHASSKEHAEQICDFCLVEPDVGLVYRSLETDDVLAAGFARLLLYTDPKPLPEVGDFRGAWDYYIRTWRPGEPHRHTWDQLYAQAMDVLV